MKKKEICKVVSQEELSGGIFSMDLEAETIAREARPGQFVMVYSRDSAKMLGRPISLCGIDPKQGRIRLVYRVTGSGTGTEEFSRLSAGDTVSVLGPLGNGFPLEKAAGKNLLLAGGGIGIPPLLETEKQAEAKCTAVLGYRDGRLFLNDAFAEAGELLIATEDGSAGTHGNIMDAIRENDLYPDIIFACGPIPMLRALAAWAEGKDIPCYISLEERMACGIGACLGCVCKTKETDEHTHVHNRRICKEGPVFLSTEVEL